MPALVFDTPTRERLAGNPRRAAFYCGAVASLAGALAARGTRLICRRGSLAGTARRLARDVGAGTVVWSASYDAASRERARRLQSTFEESGLRALIVHDAPAVAPEETAAARSGEDGLGYRALAPYLTAWEGRAHAPFFAQLRFASPDVPTEPLPAPEEFDAPRADAPPSEARALDALETYLEGPALNYRTARHIPADGPTSRLSAELSFGTISARTILARIEARMGDAFLLAEERASLRVFVRALAQRDFFLQLAWFFEGTRDEPLQAKMRLFPFAKGHPLLGAWREGRTGYPLVDAGIRQLRASGWMHPRARLIAASFLCFDLAVDWRVGRDEWDRHLVEDEPALATGNWQWIGAVGADLAQFPRIYNPRKAARTFDARGAYVRRWIPELATVPDADILDPPAAARRRQLALPLFDTSVYAGPIVDHEEAARAFLRRYAAFR